MTPAFGRSSGLDRLATCLSTIPSVSDTAVCTASTRSCENIKQSKPPLAANGSKMPQQLIPTRPSPRWRIVALTVPIRSDLMTTLIYLGDFRPVS